MARGDLIYVICTWQGIPYRHYGIDVGDQRAIHLARRPGTVTTWEVHEVTHQQFALAQRRRRDGDEGDVQARIQVEPVLNPLEVEETIRLASMQLGRKGYHLSENNCEHFARHCKTGTGVSWQVQQVKSGAACGIRWCVKLAAKSPFVAQSLKIAVPAALKSWKTAPLLIVSDVAEWGASRLAQAGGHDPKASEKLGRAVGIATAASVGTLVAGPLGGAAMVGMHVVSAEIAERVVSLAASKNYLAAETAPSGRG